MKKPAHDQVSCLSRLSHPYDNPYICVPPIPYLVNRVNRLSLQRLARYQVISSTLLILSFSYTTTSITVFTQCCASFPQGIFYSTTVDLVNQRHPAQPTDVSVLNLTSPFDTWLPSQLKELESIQRSTMSFLVYQKHTCF